MARAERCQRQAAAGWVFTSNGALYRGSPRGCILGVIQIARSGVARRCLSKRKVFITSCSGETALENGTADIKWQQYPQNGYGDERYYRQLQTNVGRRSNNQ